MEQLLRREIVYARLVLQALLAERVRMHTIDDIIALPEGVRAELLDGEMFMMASPTLRHQKTLGWLYFTIFSHIRERKGKCEVALAPFAVFLKNDRWNYVEPDVTVICNKDKLDDKGCHGAPEWAIEVVSPSSTVMDYRRKLEAYRSAGVREYWIVDPAKETVTVYDFRNGGEEPELYCFSDTIRSGILEELELDFRELKEYIDL